MFFPTNSPDEIENCITRRLFKKGVSKDKYYINKQIYRAKHHLAHDFRSTHGYAISQNAVEQIVLRTGFELRDPRLRLCRIVVHEDGHGVLEVKTHSFNRAMDVMAKEVARRRSASSYKSAALAIDAPSKMTTKM